jgi:hypothetical protein
MDKPFDDRLIDAVRVTGPNALPSAILLEMDGGEMRILGTSLARVLSRLEHLSLQGILRQTVVVDERGRDRKAYSMGTGRIRRQTTPSFGGLATA